MPLTVSAEGEAGHLMAGPHSAATMTLRGCSARGGRGGRGGKNPAGGHHTMAGKHWDQQRRSMASSASDNSSRPDSNPPVGTFTVPVKSSIEADESETDLKSGSIAEETSEEESGSETDDDDEEDEKRALEDSHLIEGWLFCYPNWC